MDHVVSTHTHTHTHTHSELLTAGSSSPLATIVAKNIKKAVKLFNMKCDELTMLGRVEAVQVSGGPNHAQLRNITVVNTLHIFNTIMQQVKDHMCWVLVTTVIYMYMYMYIQKYRKGPCSLVHPKTLT